MEYVDSCLPVAGEAAKLVFFLLKTKKRLLYKAYKVEKLALVSHKGLNFFLLRLP